MRPAASRWPSWHVCRRAGAKARRHLANNNGNVPKEKYLMPRRYHGSKADSYSRRHTPSMARSWAWRRALSWWRKTPTRGISSRARQILSPMLATYRLVKCLSWRRPHLRRNISYAIEQKYNARRPCRAATSRREMAPGIVDFTHRVRGCVHRRRRKARACFSPAYVRADKLKWRRSAPTVMPIDAAMTHRSAKGLFVVT